MAAVALGGMAAAQPPTEELVLLGEQEGGFTFGATLNVGPDPSAVTARVVFNYHDEQSHYELVLADGRAQFRRVQGGEAVNIGRHGAVTATSGEHSLYVQRRSWRMSLIWDDTVVCSAYDSALSGGQVGYAANGVEVTDAFVQVAPPVLWTDDFMRAGDTPSPWEPVAGTWQQRELRTEAQREQDPTRSANAFCCHGQGDDGPALAIAGEAQQLWFWDDYSYSVAVKSGGGAVGALFFYQDPSNYLLLRCGSESAPEAPQTQLISVVNGERAVLAESPGGIVPMQWYALRVNVSGGSIEAFVDDRLVLTAQTELFGQGQIGLYAEGEQGADFDDVWAESWTVCLDDFSQHEPGRWTAAAGEWSAPQKGAVARAGRGEAVLISGDPTWTDYVYGADVKTTKRAGAGIALRASDAGRLVFRWAPQGSGLPYAGQAQLVQVTGGQAQVLAEGPATLDAGAAHRFEASCDGGHIVASVDGERMLECVAASLPQGGIGLYADGEGRVSFDNVSVRLPKRTRAATINARFESPGDSTMQAWATKAGQWTAEKNQSTYWHVGDFFGDKSIRCTIPSVGQRSGSATITLSGDVKQPQAGYRLVITTFQNQPTVKLAIYQGQARLQESQIDVPGRQNAELTVEHTGDHILAYINGRCILTQKMER